MLDLSAELLGLEIDFLRVSSELDLPGDCGSEPRDCMLRSGEPFCMLEPMLLFNLLLCSPVVDCAGWTDICAAKAVQVCVCVVWCVCVCVCMCV